jgi:3-dehydroquinate dehydratase-2
VAKLLVLHGPNLNLLGSREPGDLRHHHPGRDRGRPGKNAPTPPATGTGSLQSNAEHVLIEPGPGRARRRHRLHPDQSRPHSPIPAWPCATRWPPSPSRSSRVHLSNPHAREPFRHKSISPTRRSAWSAASVPMGYGLALTAAWRQLATHLERDPDRNLILSLFLGRGGTTRYGGHDGPAQDQEADRPAGRIQPQRDRDQGRRGIRAPGAPSQGRPDDDGRADASAPRCARGAARAGAAWPIAGGSRHRRPAAERPARRPRDALADGRHLLCLAQPGRAGLREGRPSGQGRRHARHHRGDEDVQPDRGRRLRHRRSRCSPRAASRWNSTNRCS